MTQPDLYLASRSPRRRELLAQIGIRHALLAGDIDETPRVGETPSDYVVRLARHKAQAPTGDADRPVLGADTTVVLAGQIFGKPADRQAAIDMLLALSDRSHEVMSAVAISDGSRTEHRLSISRVHFAAIEPEQAQAYWETGEPLDKAGGYAIQGRAAAFVRRLEGSYSGVMGLPLFETAQLCRDFGIPVLGGAQA